LEATGDIFSLTLVNELGPNPAGEDTTMNTMHSPNTTNLHTHGLHIDPVIDTIFTKLAPGASHTYEYEVLRLALSLLRSPLMPGCWFDVPAMYDVHAPGAEAPDAVLMAVGGAEMQVPTNHAPGLYWYHDHTHGSSALKVMGEQP
jgi:FtsP/CotA-like multicopper oxidase with cupredoxin domain